MTLQEYLGKNYKVTKIVDEEGKVSFNVKRGGFDYTSAAYTEAALPNIIKILGNAIQTKYNTFLLLQEMK